MGHDTRAAVGQQRGMAVRADGGSRNLLFQLHEDKFQDVVAGDASRLAVALALTAHHQEHDIESEHAGPEEAIRLGG